MSRLDLFGLAMALGGVGGLVTGWLMGIFWALFFSCPSWHAFIK